MSERKCGVCKGRCDNAFVCGGCMRTLRSRLVGGDGYGSVGQLVGQLDLTLSRQDKMSSSNTGVKSKGAESPLPFSQSASEALWALHGVLSWAVRVVARPGRGPEALTDIGPSGETHGFALVLAAPAWQHGIAQAEAGTEVHHAVTGAIGRAWAVVDRPPEQRYAGPCDTCHRDLYAVSGESDVECACGAHYDVSTRRSWLLGRVEDQLITAVEASRALPGLLERDLSVDTIRSWIHRTRLIVRAYVHEGRIVHERIDRTSQPLCRVGDLIELLNEQRKADEGRRRQREKKAS